MPTKSRKRRKKQKIRKESKRKSKQKTPSRIEVYVTQPAKKTLYHSCEKLGGAATIFGLVGLVVTGIAHYASHKTGQSSGLDLFFGKLFHHWTPIDKNIGLTAYRHARDIYLYSGYLTSSVLTVGGYFIHKIGKRGLYRRKKRV